MRITIYFSIFFLAFTGLVKAQETNIISYWVKINPDIFTVEQTKDQIQTSDTVLNRLINKGVVVDFHQSFPFSKKPELQQLYTVKCERKDSILVSEILSSSNSFIECIFKDQSVPLFEPTDWHYRGGYQWYLDHIEANKAWDITKGSSNVTMAIIDTKFDRYHPDLENQYIVGYDPYTLIDHVWLEPGSNIDNHGTAVASTAIAETNGGGDMASIGFNTKFYAYTYDDPLEKAQHASLVLGVDVISISFFYRCSSDPYATTILNEIIDNGTIVVAAAGNGDQHCSGQDVCPFCALNDNRVIVVSTTGHNDEHTLYKDGVLTTDSHYPNVDLCAPGIDIMVAVPSKNNGWPYYGSSDATSIATPMVSATCALMRSVNPCISPEQVETVLKNTADPITDEYLYPGLVGAGRLNVYQAVLGAIEEGTTHYDNMNFTGTHTYSSGLYLSSANSTVKNGSHITFQAGKDITLDSGFTIELGGEFTTGSIAVSCP